jgi:hypothetical protein
MVVKTSVPLDHEKMTTVFSGSPAKVGGYNVQRLTGPGPTAMFVPNQKIAVFSDLPDDQLGRLAKSSGTKSVLAGDMDFLASKFSNTTIWAVIGPAAISDARFQAGMKSTLATNPAAKSLDSMLQSARGLGIAIDLAGGDVAFRYGILCADEAAAQKTVAELRQANDKAKSDPAAKLAMLMMPAWVKKMQSESESSMQYAADGPLAVVSARLSMATVKDAIDGVLSFLPKPGAGPVGADGSGAAPLMIPKNRGR